MSKRTILCILDGWGFHADSTDNAVALANTPNFDRLWQSCPHSFLKACGEDVGLPKGQIGNSEVGHTNIGAGRVVYQELPRIDNAIANDELKDNPALKDFIARMKACPNGKQGTAHVMGLISPGGVHAHQDHAVALVRELSDAGIPVAIHAFLDGRDVPPQSAHGQLQKFLADIAPYKNARLATLVGRYYAMDRDQRWERIQKAYNLIVDGAGTHANDALAAITASYAGDVHDEFILPVVLGDYRGMQDGDGILFTNYRADRARQLLDALLMPDFTGFTRGRVIGFAAALGMSGYSEYLNTRMAVLFPQTDLKDTLGETVSNAGLKQLRAAETEKYPHVTYFLNGGAEISFAGEDRVMAASPKVATYDLQPEMSARKLTDKVLAAFDKTRYDLTVINFANPDMVGHTGILDAAITACETVDECLGRLLHYAEQNDVALLVTADHGNAEVMRDPVTHAPHTAHTLNLVPLLAFNTGAAQLEDGRLADLAPTILALLGLPQPVLMTGRNLIAA